MGDTRQIKAPMDSTRQQQYVIEQSRAINGYAADEQVRGNESEQLQSYGQQVSCMGQGNALSSSVQTFVQANNQGLDNNQASKSQGLFRSPSIRPFAEFGNGNNGPSISIYPGYTSEQTLVQSPSYYQIEPNLSSQPEGHSGALETSNYFRVPAESYTSYNHQSNIWTNNSQPCNYGYVACYDQPSQHLRNHQQENIQDSFVYYNEPAQSALHQDCCERLPSDYERRQCHDGRLNGAIYKTYESFGASNLSQQQQCMDSSNLGSGQVSQTSNKPGISPHVQSHQLWKSQPEPADSLCRLEQPSTEVKSDLLLDVDPLETTRFRPSDIEEKKVIFQPEAKSLSSSNGLRTQQRINQCSICGRNYARPSTLKTHLRTHTNERPFKCSVCLKTFSQAANLTAHQRVHTGERPFSCPICGRQFSQSSSVITHLRTHSGERPYRCNLCSRTFSDSSTLTKHCRIHSGEKPYQCDFCPLNFSQSGNLSRHLKLHSIQTSSITGSETGNGNRDPSTYTRANSTASPSSSSSSQASTRHEHMLLPVAQYSSIGDFSGLNKTSEQQQLA